MGAMSFAEFSEIIARHEPALRFAAFLGTLALFAALEALAPKRSRVFPRVLRWGGNLAIVALDTAMLRVLFPVLAVGAAAYADAEGLGFFHAVAVPEWAAFAGSLLLLDLAIYVQHRIFHRVPLLWRLHRMHHTDRDVDATTAIRFHPFEIALSMGIKMGIVVALGAPVAAVIVFEVVLNALSIFNHANLALPARLDRALRLVLVTPDMHRVHHSVIPAETDSNFGFNLSVWDRLLGTYRRQPRDGHAAMAIGLSDFADRRPLNLFVLLRMPFLPLPSPGGGTIDAETGP